MTPRRVRVTEPVHPDVLALLRDAGWEVSGPPQDEDVATVAPHDDASDSDGPEPVQINGARVPAPARTDAVLVRTARLSAAAVAGVSLISKHGVGVDNIPLDVARGAGVAVMNTPGANAGAVAEQTLMLMLALARRLDAQRAAVGPVASRGLEGLRLLVVGYGATGRRVAALGAAFGMQVMVQTRAPQAEFARAPSLSEGLAEADIVTLHCPLTDATRHMIGAEALARMPVGALLVNCARGGLVDEAALVASLVRGHLGGAALDATETEPLPSDHPLRTAPNLILTPHSAAMSDGAFRRMGMMAAQNILDFFAGCPRAECMVVTPDAG